MGWSLREHQKEPSRLAHLLYWQELLDPEGSADVVTQSDCSLLSTLRYRGSDQESASDAEKMVGCRQLHEVLRTVEAGWGLHAEVRRRKAGPYPRRQWPHPAAALVDLECEAQVHEAHFETDYAFTFTKHLRGLGDAWKHLLWSNIPEEQRPHAPSQRFRDEVARIASDLGGVLPAVDIMRGEDFLTFLKSTISLVDQRVGIPDPPWFLASGLSDQGYTPGSVLQLGDCYVRIIAVRNNRRTRQAGYPPTTLPGMLDALHDLPMEYRLVQRWLPLSLEQADKELNAYENFYLQQGKSLMSGLMEKLSGSPTRKRNAAADDAAEQVAEARRLLQEGVTPFGYCNTTLMVWDTDYAELDEKRKVLEQTLRAARFVVETETFHAHEAFLSMVPGNFYHGVRKPLIDGVNVSRMLATTSVSSGVTWVPYLQGGPWIIGTAKGQTPYGLTTHHGDVGDYFLVGPKGCGKSALQALLSLQWLQYSAKGRPQVRAFDKGGSLLCATYAVDGVWMDLTPGHCPPLQPLRYIDQEDECTWALEWVGDLLTLEHIDVGHEVRREVWAALRSLATFPPPMRTLSGLCGLVQRQDIRNALNLYTVDGAYGSLLDGDQDPLPQQADWQCFEIDGLLQRPRIVPPVMGLVYRSIRRQMDGRPTLCSYDEVWAVMLHEAILDRMLDDVKTVRRLSGTMAFVTQELFDVHQSRIAQAIINACMTRIYGANPNIIDTEPSKIYTGYGLTDRQREIVAELAPTREYYITTQAHGHRRFTCNMGPITQAFCGRSRIEEIAAIQEVKAVAREPFAVAWLRHEGLEEAANLLAESFDEKGRADAAVATMVSLAGTPEVLG
jgi:type IV secretory pathway VirB4 component